MLIALIALDEHTRDNGCLQVIAGSHRHRVGYRAEQWGERHAIPEEVDRLLAAGHEHAWCEVTPAAWSSLRLSRCIRVFPMKQLIRGGRLSAVSTRFTIVPMGSPIGASPRFPGPTICYWTMERNTWRDCEAEAMRRIRSEMRRRSLRWFLHFPRTPGSTHQMYLSDVGRSV
ncbi:MAG: hypothetical protein CMQ05_13085 [Gammaproteobacteria bacterium]|nr:hypothetical protein [Gammaproteobacteria bacterium]RPG25344.1 MAG: hypothetical protein CBC10_009305 [Gammaproteobacteria bacterium TMED50]